MVKAIYGPLVQNSDTVPLKGSSNMLLMMLNVIKHIFPLNAILIYFCFNIMSFCLLFSGFMFFLASIFVHK